MPRRLIRDRERERAEQERLQARISAAGQRAIRQEVARETDRLLLGWQATGNVPGVEEHTRRVAVLIDRLHSVAIRATAARTEDQLKSAAPQYRKAEGQGLYERIEAEYMRIAGGARIAGDISGSTRKMIMRQIRSGQRQGLSGAEIVRNIRATVPVVSAARAAVIARTETHNAANFAHMETAKESGVVTRKEWLAARDDRTRDDEFSHVDADGQIVGIDEPFTVSGEQLMYPGDQNGSAGNIINCRCAVTFLVED